MNGTIVFKNGHREKIVYSLRIDDEDLTDSILCSYSLYFSSESGIYKMSYRKLQCLNGCNIKEDQVFYKLALTDLGNFPTYEEDDSIDFLIFDDENSKKPKLAGIVDFKNEGRFEPLTYNFIREIIKECRNDKDAQVNLFVNSEGSMNLSIMPIIEKEKK